MTTFKCGDRVMAGDTGPRMPGTVTTVINSSWDPNPQYMVWLDRNKHGHSGPFRFLSPLEDKG